MKFPTQLSGLNLSSSCLSLFHTFVFLRIHTITFSIRRKKKIIISTLVQASRPIMMEIMKKIGETWSLPPTKRRKTYLYNEVVVGRFISRRLCTALSAKWVKLATNQFYIFLVCYWYMLFKFELQNLFLRVLHQSMY